VNQQRGERYMTRKDFELIARVVKSIQDKDVRNATALNFATELRHVNPRFNTTRFVSACTEEK
jgi:pentose-5-phosphate-3-epimerase|tara:strand:+ start:179 stop:367 length:189 start_codon:yes stop_codon:yes gene_type:complete